MPGHFGLTGLPISGHVIGFFALTSGSQTLRGQMTPQHVVPCCGQPCLDTRGGCIISRKRGMPQAHDAATCFAGRPTCQSSQPAPYAPTVKDSREFLTMVHPGAGGWQQCCLKSLDDIRQGEGVCRGFGRGAARPTG